MRSARQHRHCPHVPAGRLAGGRGPQSVLQKKSSTSFPIALGSFSEKREKKLRKKKPAMHK